jgi:dUTPase
MIQEKYLHDDMPRLEIIEVDNLNGIDRGGFGSTGN